MEETEAGLQRPLYLRFVVRIASINARCALLIQMSRRSAWSVNFYVYLGHDREPYRLEEPRIRWGTYGRHLANTIERSVLGGDEGCSYQLQQFLL